MTPKRCSANAQRVAVTEKRQPTLRDFASRLALPHLPKPRQYYEAKTEALVRKSWFAIEGVAEPLLVARYCYGEQVDMIISDAGVHRSVQPD